jgi:hypothetical protein
MRRGRKTPETYDPVTTEYLENIRRIWGENAVRAEIEDGLYMGPVPFGGAIIMPDPGEFRPVPYKDMGFSEKDVLRAAIAGVEMAYAAPLTSEE